MSAFFLLEVRTKLPMRAPGPFRVIVRARKAPPDGAPDWMTAVPHRAGLLRPTTAMGGSTLVLRFVHQVKWHSSQETLPGFEMMQRPPRRGIFWSLPQPPQTPCTSGVRLLVVPPPPCPGSTSPPPPEIKIQPGPRATENGDAGSIPQSPTRMGVFALSGNYAGPTFGQESAAACCNPRATSRENLAALLLPPAHRFSPFCRFSTTRQWAHRSDTLAMGFLVFVVWAFTCSPKVRAIVFFEP